MAKRTPAHVREQQIDNLPNITFVRWDGEYRGNRTKAVCRCTIDEFEWSASVYSLVNNGTGCPNCAGNRHQTANERIEQINTLPDITFVRWDGKYRNKYSKAVCRCDNDGHEWSASVDNLIHGSSCPECAGQRRWTANERNEQINALSNITFVRWESEYRNKYSKAVCRCDKGHEWSASVASLVNNGTGCPNCAVSGYNPSKPGTLYALRSECGTMVKIGISNDYTNRLTALKRITPFGWLCTELLHGDGALIAGLEKAFHSMTESAISDGQFDGYTEWRKWTPELTGWFDTWKSLTPKENENV